MGSNKVFRCAGLLCNILHNDLTLRCAGLLCNILHNDLTLRPSHTYHSMLADHSRVTTLAIL